MEGVGWIMTVIIGGLAGWIANLVIAIVGACLLIWGYRAVKGRS